MVAAARTINALIEEIRQRSDHENSNFVTDTELGGWVNQSAADLHDLIIDYAGGEACQTSTTTNLPAGVSDLSLPSDFYRLVGVDARFSSGVRALRPYRQRDRNRYQHVTGWTSPRDCAYRLAGRTDPSGAVGDAIAQLRCIPVPPREVEITVWYIPLAFDADSALSELITSVNGWDEYIVADVCAKIIEKKDGDARPFHTRREAARLRIIAAAKRLDMGEAPRMRDALEEHLRDDDEPLGYG